MTSLVLCVGDRVRFRHPYADELLPDGTQLPMRLIALAVDQGLVETDNGMTILPTQWVGVDELEAME